MLVGKVSPIICFLENFHKKAVLQISIKNGFLRKGTQQFALLKSFQKKKFFKKFPQKLFDEKKFNKICVVWKFSHKIYLSKNFHTKSICRKISKKNQLAEKFYNNLLCWKVFTQELLFFISTKLGFVGKFSQLALKLLCKTPKKVFVERIGSVLEKHLKPQRPRKQIIFVSEMHID